MEEILKRLFQIEEASGRILERTERRKETLRKEAEEAERAFDRGIEAGNDAFIGDLKKQLAAEREEKLSDIRVETGEREQVIRNAFAAKREAL